jgi:hypothetical protein
MNFASGYSALQPVQRKITDRHVRFSIKGMPQWVHAGFSGMGMLLAQLPPAPCQRIVGIGHLLQPGAFYAIWRRFARGVD